MSGLISDTDNVERRRLTRHEAEVDKHNNLMQASHQALEAALQLHHRLESELPTRLAVPGLAAFHQGYRNQVQEAQAEVQKARKKYDLQVKNGEALRLRGRHSVMLPSQQ